MTRRVRYRIDGHIVLFHIDADDLFAPGHDVHDWTEEVARDLKKTIFRTTPPGTSKSRHGHRGTGRLRASLTTSATRVAPTEIELLVEAKTSYATYVHGGTAGGGRSGSFIYSNLGWANRQTVDAILAAGQAHLEPPQNMRGLYMRVPPGPGGTQRYLMRVRGQRANPFLIRGYNRVASLDHPGLPLMAEPVEGR